MARPIWIDTLDQHFRDTRALMTFRGLAQTDVWKRAGVKQQRRGRRAIEKVTGGKLPFIEAIDRVRLPIVVLASCPECAELCRERGVPCDRHKARPR